MKEETKCKEKKYFTQEEVKEIVDNLNYLRQPKKEKDKVIYIWCRKCNAYHIRKPKK